MRDAARLTEKTLVPLGAAVTAIGGAAFWLASLSARVEAAQVQITDYRTFLSQAISIAEQIDRRVSRIEGKLDAFTTKKK